jgi:DNA-directed RNA polymerase specialized sigma24 family protein
MKPSAEIKVPKGWTKEEEERLRQLFLQNETPNEIANVLGRSVSAVKAKAHA